MISKKRVKDSDEKIIKDKIKDFDKRIDGVCEYLEQLSLERAQDDEQFK